ncbi:LysR family transcriptional regulator [Pendulispora albinea]|uniref:LysR family transcriptional regulator n=1 Tax=Pendulispora albinea TaxID=2741071 RepID=A0ABZ2M6I6_9BACT
MATKIEELDINLLLAFDALLDSHNVTQAARKLGITQPALSARLGRLRALFDDRLFIPGASGRGVVPTFRALELKPLVHDVVEHLRALTTPMVAFDPARSARTFVLAAYENPGTVLATRLVPRVRARAPAIRLAFVLPQPGAMAAELESGKVDLFIGGTGRADSTLMSRTLFKEDFVTAQRKGHPRGTGPLTLQEFCTLEHLLVSSRGGGFSGLVDEALERRGCERRVTVSVQSYAMAPLIVANSDLVCTLPRRFLQRFASSIDAVSPPVELEHFEFVAYWHERSHHDPGHRWLRQLVFAVAEETGAPTAPAR